MRKRQRENSRHPAAPASVPRWRATVRQEGPWVGIVATVYLALALPVVWFGRLTADEGWYLFAAKSVAAGLRPYRDFLFTQTPLVPYAYGAILSVVGWTLVTARFVSALFGLGGLLFVLAAIRRRAGVYSALLAGTVLVLNLAVTFDAAILKTQPLTLFLTGLAIWLASATGGRTEILGSVAAMTLAVLCRLSMLPALLCFWLYWLVLSGPRRVTALIAVLASAAVLAASAWFFWADGNAWFGVYQFHRVYFAGLPAAGKFGWFFLQGFFANQMPIVVAGLAAIVALAWRLSRSGLSASPWASGFHLLLLMLASHLGTTVLHGTRTVAFPTYQTSNVLFLVAFIGMGLGPLVGPGPRVRVAVLVAALVVALLGMPRQEYVVNRQGVAGPGKVAEAITKLERLPRGNGRILTFAPELALGANLELLPGYEMGSFSYFPALDDTRIGQLRILNGARVERDLVEQRASVLGLTASALYEIARGIDSSKLRRLIDSRYALAGLVTGYGQNSEVLYLFSAKSADLSKPRGPQEP